MTGACLLKPLRLTLALTCLPYTLDICSMLLLPVALPVRRYSSAASTESLPMEILSAPDLRGGTAGKGWGREPASEQAAQRTRRIHQQLFLMQPRFGWASAHHSALTHRLQAGQAALTGLKAIPAAFSEGGFHLCTPGFSFRKAWRARWLPKDAIRAYLKYAAATSRAL